jgi:hypothetical protein
MQIYRFNVIMKIIFWKMDVFILNKNKNHYDKKG